MCYALAECAEELRIVELDDVVTKLIDELDGLHRHDSVVVLLFVGKVGVGHQLGSLLESIVAARAIAPAIILV